VQSQSGAPARVCLSNVWNGDAGGELTQKLDDATALGVRAVRHVTGSNAITGGALRRARAVADELRAQGFTALLQVSPSFTEEDVTDEEINAGGAAWGSFLREYADVYPLGVQVGNEANLKVIFMYRRTLAEGATEAEAQRQARYWAERMAMAVVAFAEGVERTCPECPVTTGGLGGRTLRTGPGRAAALAYLEPLAPYVASGLIAPVLDVHVYRGPDDFARAGGQGLRWSEDFVGDMRELLDAAGWPATTAFQSTEANVPADNWRSADEQAVALEALVQGLLDVPRMQLVCLFSPWSGDNDGRFLIRPGTPVGDAVREVATEG
jgi:hypothetical protein